jgi:hypothetical protein
MECCASPSHFPSIFLMRAGHSLCHGGVGADFCGRIMPVGRCQQREAALIDTSLLYPTNIVRSPLPLCLRDRHSSEEQNLHSHVTMGHDDVSQCELLDSLSGSLASLLGITFRTSVVEFEQAGEVMTTQRLRLPVLCASPLSF